MSLTVSDSNVQAEDLGSFFKILGKISDKAGQILTNNVLKHPGRALEITSKIVTAAATKSPKAALSTLPEVISFYHPGKGFHLGKFVYFGLYKWTKNVVHYNHQHN